MNRAQQLIEALKRHYEPPKTKPVGGYLVTEIQAPTSTRRADALWLPVNTAQRGRIVGYETKVSRADVVQELRDPMKADAWLQYCNEWWLLIPDTAIIEGLDIPEEWGIMTPPTDPRRRSMTVIRKAPALVPSGDAREAFSTVLAKLVYGGETLQQRLVAAENLSTWREEKRREMEDELRRLRAAAGEQPGMHLRVSEIVDALQTRADELGMWRVRHDLTPAKVADFIVAFMAIENPKDYVVREMEATVRAAYERAADLRKVLEALS